MVCVHRDVKPSHCIPFLFLDERGDRVVTEQTRFRSTVFLCSKFQSEYIYSGVNFCGKNVYVNFFCRWLEKSQKLEPAKISCHTVSVVYLNFVCFVDSLSLFLTKKFLKNHPVRTRKASVHLKFSLIACNKIELQLERPHRVKLSKLNQVGSKWTEFLSPKKVFFSLFNQQYFCKV